MGWTGIFNAITKDNGSIDRRATLENIFGSWSNGDKTTKMLKSGMNGTTFYAAMETTTPTAREVWALVVLTSVSGREFCYKEMDETEGPYKYDCPAAILDMLTPTDNENANAWREECRKKAAEKRKKGATIPRSATEIYITFKRDNNAAKAGETGTVYRRFDKWIFTDKNGNPWRITAAMLHNPEFLTVNGTNADKKPRETYEQTTLDFTEETPAEDQTATPEETTAPKFFTYVVRTYAGHAAHDPMLSETTIKAADDEAAYTIAAHITNGKPYTINRAWAAEIDAPEGHKNAATEDAQTQTETAEKAAEAPADHTNDETPAETVKKPAESPQKAAKLCYNVVIYTTAQGVRRADIRTASGRPYMDIPAAELDAIREEIARKDPERVQFNIDDTTTAHTTTPGDSTPRATKEARTDYRRARLKGHATTEAATTSAEIRSRARNRVKAPRRTQRTAGNNYTAHHGNDP